EPEQPSHAKLASASAPAPANRTRPINTVASMYAALGLVEMTMIRNILPAGQAGPAIKPERLWFPE
ncbi:MAG TPA: hypothetical protein VFS67_20685, partial [Polyangiaceae bacterium]|nr:hypothetical protein [Polyangiaceae bacterium]